MLSITYNPRCVLLYSSYGFGSSTPINSTDEMYFDISLYSTPFESFIIIWVITSFSCGYILIILEKLTK